MSGAALAALPAAPGVAARPRYRALGAFRFGLALLVMLQHFQHLLPPPARAPFQALGLGVLAVAVFFALSGFIVAEALTGFYAGRPAGFLGNRVLRLAPPYIAALALSVLVHAALWQGGRLHPWEAPLPAAPWSPWLIAENVRQLLPGLAPAGEFAFIPFVWTLRVEFAFYLVAFLVALAGSRLLPALAVAAAYLWFGAFLLRDHPLIAADAPFFALGVVAFWCLRQPVPLRAAGLAAAAAAALLAFACWHQPPGRDLSLQLPLLAALLGGALLCAAAPTPARRLRGWDRGLGDLSYPLYLNHYVVGLAVSNLTPWRGALPYAAGVMLSLGLAALMHRLTETPLRGLRDRLRGQSL